MRDATKLDIYFKDDKALFLIPLAPFFLDYTFANVEVQRYELLAWDKTISDHVGQMMEINVGLLLKPH